MRAMSGPAGGIFISYRRGEASYIAGRLYDQLADRFGDDRVFIDVDNVELGIDFAKAVTQAVSTSEVLLAVIGPHWHTPSTPMATAGWTTPTTSSAWKSKWPCNATSG
jgi:hypothetical protein